MVQKGKVLLISSTMVFELKSVTVTKTLSALDRIVRT